MICDVIVPAAEAGKVPNMDLGILAHGESNVALGGSTSKERSHSAFADVDSFMDAAARGDADKYSFSTLQEATVFAATIIEDLNNRGHEILNRLRGAEDTPQRIMPSSCN